MAVSEHLNSRERWNRNQMHFLQWAELAQWSLCCGETLSACLYLTHAGQWVLLHEERLMGTQRVTQTEFPHWVGEQGGPGSCPIHLKIQFPWPLHNHVPAADLVHWRTKCATATLKNVHSLSGVTCISWFLKGNRGKLTCCLLCLNTIYLRQGPKRPFIFKGQNWFQRNFWVLTVGNI